MFALRKIHKDGWESNHSLSQGYLIFDREKCPEEFEREFELYYGTGKNDPTYSNVYCFIKSGSLIFPLSTGYKNYIVSENGNTYQNLTFK